MSLMVLKGCQSNKHLNIPDLMLDTVNVQLVKKRSCDANFCPFCQEWEKLDIWRSKNDFSLLLILFQNWYLTSDKALSKANLSSCRVLPPVTTELYCDYCVAPLQLLFLFLYIVIYICLVQSVFLSWHWFWIYEVFLLFERGAGNEAWSFCVVWGV